MGQVFLGFRSLLIKLAVFVVMAALLAWALGGTLFPRPEVARLEPVSFAGQSWFWQVSVGGKNEGEIRWQLMRHVGREDPEPLKTSGNWIDHARLVPANDSLYFGGRDEMHGWQLGRINARGEIELQAMPDRLAVEVQLARVAHGLPVQDTHTIRTQRELILNSPGQ